MKPRPVDTFVFLAIVASVALLPSGNVFGFQVKPLVLAVGALLMAMRAATGNGISLVWFLWVLSAAGFLLYGFVVLVTSVNSPADPTGQLRAFLSVFSVFFVLLYFVDRNLVSIPRALSIIVGVGLSYSLAKIVLEILLISGLLDMSSIRESMYLIFGVSFIYLDVGWGYRINFPVDFLLVPVLIALFFNFVNYRFAIRALAIVLVLAAIFISYSRFLWVFTLFVLVLELVRKSNVPRAGHFLALSLLLITPVFFGNAVAERFFGWAAQSSDSARADMFPLIWAAVMDSPIIGWGLGWYLEDLIRIDSAPWYYELQWLALWMQFGVAGLTYLTTLVLFLPGRVVLSTKWIYIVLIYMMWLSTGLFNGFFLTSSAGLVFFAFWLLFHDERIKTNRILPSAVPSNGRK